MSKIGKIAGLLLLAQCVGMARVEPAWATPAFARKYETSCETCHVAFPKLTAFGEAFRRNGYRFPAGEDEDAAVIEDTPLGHPAYRDVFPKAVWPGHTPGALLAATLGSTLAYVGEEGLDTSAIGGSAGLVAAGALGGLVSGWVGLEIEAEQEAGEEHVELELERVFLAISPFEEPRLNVRVGRYELALPGITPHRLLGPASWLNTTPIADNSFTLEPSQSGIGADGVLGGRLLYQSGVVEGRGNTADGRVDTYGRIAAKIGRIRANGVGGATTPQAWRDNHVTIGAFGLSGAAQIGDETANQLDHYARYGGDIEAWWWNLQLHAAYMHGTDDQPSLREPGTGVTSDFVFTQLDWVAYPWLIPSARWEIRRVGEGDEHRLIPAVYTLLRANVRVNAFAIFTGDPSPRFDRVGAGVAAAF